MILVLDSIMIHDIPPLRACWAPAGAAVPVPIFGSHRKQVLTGVLNIVTGTHLCHASPGFNQDIFQDVLRQVRAQWRGWRIVLFLDKHSGHTAALSRALAGQLGIELRWLPTATPELNVIDCLWRHVRDDVLANEPLPRLRDTVARAVAYLQELSPQERLRHAGVLSPRFWLHAVRESLMSKYLCVPT